MTDPRPDLAPQQQRSREALQRILGATLKLLDRSGLSAATIPRIAAEAELAPANIYRRFADKDALLRAAFIHILKRANDGNREHLHRLVLRETLDETVRVLFQAQLTQYREHGQLLRALRHYFDLDTDPSFLAEAKAIVLDNLRLVSDTLLVFRAEIQHAHPERAARFAVLNAIGTMESITLDPRSLWPDAAPMTDEELIEELASTWVSYLRNS